MARQYRAYSYIDGTVTSHDTADEAVAAARALATAVVADPRAASAAALAAGEGYVAAVLAKHDLGETEEDEAPDGTYICGLWADGEGDPLPLAFADELGRTDPALKRLNERPHHDPLSQQTTAAQWRLRGSWTI